MPPNLSRSRVPTLRATRAAIAAVAALTAAPLPLAAQRVRADVQSFQWDPVVVHVGVEHPTGVEIYLATDNRHWALSWFPPASVAAWAPSLAKMLKHPPVDGESTPALRGRFGSELRVVTGTVQGNLAYGLEISGPPTPATLVAWLNRDYARAFAKAVAKSPDVARKLAHLAPDTVVSRVYEEWEVDEIPVGADYQRVFGAVPADSYGGRVTLSFIVDTLGHIEPGSVSVLGSDDPRIGKRFAAVAPSWPFEPGILGKRKVPTRVITSFDLQSELRVQVNNPRVLPGGP